MQVLTEAERVDKRRLSSLMDCDKEIAIRMQEAL